MSAIQFITLIRLPFSRGDFIDPPQADWNASKDRALWKVISKSSKTSDLNWTELATKFQVPQSFLLQQAAWLYERHLEHVRTQMKKVGSANAPTASGSGSANTAVGGVPMQRGGSHGSRSSRAPSALSIRARDGPSPRAETSTPVSAFAPAPPLSRTPSTNTITQSKAHILSNPNRTQAQQSARPSFTGPRPPIPVGTATPHQKQDVDDDSPASAALSSSSSSSSDSDMEAPIHRSQLFKRPPRFQKQRPRDLPSYDEDPDEGEDVEHSDDISLPFAQPQRTTPAAGETASGNTEAGPSDTSRGVHQTKLGQHQRVNSGRTDVSSSLASSASDAPKPSKVGPGPISPRHRAELGRLARKDGSEGTPSMGSSFSDLDGDASISQSALEEALLSNIHAGRMSTFSQLRSRYL